MGRNRYEAAKKTVVDGIKFDSKHEANVYQDLRLMEKAGVIKDLRLQPRYAIEIGGVQVLMKSNGYPNGRQLKYVADFEYYDCELEELKIVDAKGHMTEVFKIKRALMEAMGKPVTLVLAQKRKRRRGR